jgi:hypothetical protein
VGGQDETRARAVLIAMQERLAIGPYFALGIDSSATVSQIRTAFLELTKTYHPARFGYMSAELQRLANEVFLSLRAAHDAVARPARVAAARNERSGVFPGAVKSDRSGVFPGAVKSDRSGVFPAVVPRSSDRSGVFPAVVPRSSDRSGVFPAVVPRNGDRGDRNGDRGDRNGDQSGAVPALVPRSSDRSGAVPALVPRSSDRSGAVPALVPRSSDRSGAVPAVPARGGDRADGGPPQAGRVTPPLGVPAMPQAGRTTPAMGVRVGAMRPPAPPSAAPRPEERELAGALEQLSRGQWAAARATLSSLAARAPGVPRYRALLSYARGREAQIAQRLDEARVELQAALQIDPDLQLAKTALAELFTRRK